jgi:hypothetical protein
MSEIRTEVVTINVLLGETGGSAVMQKTPVGFLLDIYLNYHASCPNTADVTISDPNIGNILVVSNNATDGLYAPRKATVDAAGAATGLYDMFPVNVPLTIAIAQADVLTACLIATIRWLVP